MVSKPDFDPGSVAENWESLNTNEEAVLLNRVTQGHYVPGSTFKIVTALEYMRENPDVSSYSYNCTGEIDSGSNTIHCFGGKVHGTVDFRDSLAYSCNTSFSNMGQELDVEKFQQTTQELLFNSKLPSVLPYKKSSFTLSKDAGTAEKMMTAMGQGQTQVSPYHMALITSAIANGGTLMEPYLVDSVTNYKGVIIDVVEYGTASVLSGQSYTAAGKTGTAEYSSDKEKDHSWFVGMSNVDNPDLAISVIIEGSDGTAKAVNVAKKVFDAYY